MTDARKRIAELEEALREDWADLPQYEPTGYQVSNLGRVRRNGKILKNQIDRYGYHRIWLREGNKRKFKTVHSVVAEAFIGPRPDGAEIAHINEDKSNNSVANISYVTPSENRHHSVVNGTVAAGERHGCSKLTEADVKFIRTNIKLRCRRYGVRPLARMFGVDPSTIRRAANGNNWRRT